MVTSPPRRTSGSWLADAATPTGYATGYAPVGDTSSCKLNMTHMIAWPGAPARARGVRVDGKNVPRRLTSGARTVSGRSELASGLTVMFDIFPRLHRLKETVLFWSKPRYHFRVLMRRARKQRLCVRSCISPLIRFRRAVARALVLCHTRDTPVVRYVLCHGIGHLHARRISTTFRECGPLGSERPVFGSGA